MEKGDRPRAEGPAETLRLHGDKQILRDRRSVCGNLQREVPDGVGRDSDVEFVIRLALGRPERELLRGADMIHWNEPDAVEA